MAQENPLRNRVFYGTPDGVALDRGSAEAWRNAQAPRPAPAASPVPPTKPAALSRAGSLGKWAGRVGGVAGVATEALRLADVGKDGKEAVYAELPRSAGRLGGAWAGSKALGAAGTTVQNWGQSRLLKTCSALTARKTGVRVDFLRVHQG